VGSSDRLQGSFCFSCENVAYGEDCKSLCISNTVNPVLNPDLTCAFPRPRPPDRRPDLTCVFLRPPDL
jgi:hypothetical protein